jgi:hypothetical protein
MNANHFVSPPHHTNGLKTISARRKMWGEDGNGARRMKLPPFY